jgi:putative FmdB family regulatory protein
MPLYEYRCPKCEAVVEVIQSFSDKSQPVCYADTTKHGPDRGCVDMERLISAPYRAIITKGCTGAQLH